MRRLLALLPVLIAFQAGVPPALAWTWPADGPVLRTYSFGGDPYIAGHHRGVDVAGETGAPVRSPRAGIVSFAGSVPGGGRTVTVRTSDGLSVTLVHLGEILVARDDLLAEGDVVGEIGASGDSEHSRPYVHLGVRVTSDEQGYRDPLSFLPERGPADAASAGPSAEPAPAPSTEAPEAPSSEPGSPAPTLPSEAPAPVTPTTEGPASAPEAPAPVPPVPATLPHAPAPTGEAPTHAAGERPGPDALAGEFSARGGRERSTGDVQAASGRELGALDQGGEASRSRAERPLPVSAAGTIPSPRPNLAGSPLEGRRTSAVPPVALAGAGIAAAILTLCAGLARRRRQLSPAGAANALTAMLEDGAGRTTEHAGGARSSQEDRLALDRDLERVVLDEPEPPSDLDRNDDSAELVQVTNDACRRPRATIAATRFHRLRPPPTSRCRRFGAASLS